MKMTITTLTTTLLFIFTSITAWAYPVLNGTNATLGTNITIFDGQEDTSKNWYTGQGIGQEDEETEPATARSHVWDLEAMFLNGTNLSLVGEWDFVNGHDGASGIYDRDGDGKYTSGDIFIDVDGVNHASAYGYDYVFDVDWTSGSYTLYQLNAQSTFLKTTYKQDSNPWKLDANGTDTGITGNFEISLLSEELVNEKGLLGDAYHYVVSFDLDPILDSEGIEKMDFTAHFTMECGNDDLMGQGTAPVPEPATIVLMGVGLLGIAGFTRKKLNLERQS